MAGKRSKSSDRWLRRQKRDYFANRAQAEGHVSRAHFKLQQIDEKYRLLNKGSRVLELGAAPGGWTNFIESKLSNKGRLIVVDPLPITTGANTLVVTGLAGEAEIDAAIEECVQASCDGQLDLVLSDMAPNMSGVRAVDQARSMALADVAMEAAAKWLRPKGALVLKSFQGEGLDTWVAERKQEFDSVLITKPKASRPDSREIFVVARGYKRMRDGVHGLV